MQTTVPAPTSAQLSVTFDAMQRAKLRRLADAQDRSIGYVVRAAVDALPDPADAAEAQAA